MKSLTQPVLLVGALGCLVWLLKYVVPKLDAKQETITRDGICIKEWRVKQRRVSQNMDGFYERAFRRMAGIRSGIEQFTNRAERSE